MRQLPLLLALTVTLAGCDFFGGSAPRPTTDSTPAPQAGAAEVDTEPPVTKVATDLSQPTTTYMYVVNSMGKTIDEINLKTMAVTLGVFPTGEVPNQLATEGAATYLVNSGDADLTKFDLRAHKKLGTLSLRVGSNPMSINLLPEHRGLVVNYLSRDLEWVNLWTKKVEASASVPTGKPGGGVALVGGKAYVPAVEANYVNYTFSFSGIHVYDLATRTFLKTITLDNDALSSYYGWADISTDPQGRVVVTANNGLMVINPDTDTIVRTIDFGASAHSVQYLSATKAYAAAGDGMVSFNPETGAVLRGTANKIASGGGNFKIFGQAAYVANFASDSIRVIDLATEQASGSDLAVGDGPQDLTFITVAD